MAGGQMAWFGDQLFDGGGHGWGTLGGAAESRGGSSLSSQVCIVPLTHLLFRQEGGLPKAMETNGCADLSGIFDRMEKGRPAVRALRQR